jgi:hypothetical protein
MQTGTIWPFIVIWACLKTCRAFFDIVQDDRLNPEGGHPRECYRSSYAWQCAPPRTLIHRPYSPKETRSDLKSKFLQHREVHHHLRIERFVY